MPQKTDILFVMLDKKKNYKAFIFHGFNIDKGKNKIIFCYSFDNELFFKPEIGIDLSNVKNISNIKSAVFNLGMAELPSFYKAFCPPQIIIEAGYLNKKQIKFWESLYKNGLGEFFYQNKINFKDLIKIKISPEAPRFENSIKIKGEKILLPIGGGKDSIVSAEILKEKGFDFTWFAIEPRIASRKVIAVSKNTKTIFLKSPKKNFKKIIELNKKGAYNGHIPISAVYAFSAVLAAQIYGFKYIILSNERSANTGNTKYLGKEINHQYSKSLEFETQLNKYIKENISPDIYYFSLLRNLYDIQIMQKFSKYPRYFPVFLSCNPGLKENKWCGKCAKCTFVFAGLSAFLEAREVVKIFGKNLLEDRSLLLLYKELVGQKGIKPFDCVGTLEESLLALHLAKNKYQKLPYILKNIETKKAENFEDILKSNTKEHLIPEKFLKQKIAIAGFGIEGKAVYEHIKNTPNAEIHIFDNLEVEPPSGVVFHQNLNIPADFDLVFKTPGIPTNKLKLENPKTKITSLTNLFLENVKGTVIGVTGTKGKGTIVSLINHILKENNFKSEVVGNIGVTGLQFLKDDDKDNFYIYEMSSFQCEHLNKSPHVAVLNNIFPDHLNHHENMDDYISAKARITKFQTEKDYFINNSSYDISTKAQQVEILKDDIPKFETQLLGEHNQMNIKVASAVAKLVGVSESEARKAVKTFKPLPLRLEKVMEKKGIIFYDDPLATIPEATIASIKSLGNVNTIVLGGLNRNIPLKKFAKFLKTTQIKNFIIFPETGKIMVEHVKDRNIFEVDNMKDAVQTIFANSEGICLMSSAASSFNLFKNYKDKSEQYRYWIKKLKYSTQLKPSRKKH